MNISRRDMLKSSSLLAGLFLFQQREAFGALAPKIKMDDVGPVDWDEVRSLFHLKSNFINLHNGLSPTLTATVEKIKELNLASEAYPMDGSLELYDKLEELRKTLGKMIKAQEGEVIVTTSTTEGVNIVIQGLDFAAGDEILYTSREYPSIIEAIELKSKRTGAVPQKVQVDFNLSVDEIVSSIKKSITSRTKLLVVSHMCCRTGEILPIQEIVEMAHRLGVEVLVDGAHSFGHFDFDIKAMGCDYYASSLHKWIAGPIGTGFLYCTSEKVKKIWPMLGSEYEVDSSDILKLESFYSYGAATKVATLVSIDLHHRIGSAAKTERLSFLRQYWMTRLSDHPKVSFKTPWDPKRACGIGSFHLEGYNARELVVTIKEEHRLVLGANGSGDATLVRVTPNIYTTTSELDQMISIVRKL